LLFCVSTLEAGTVQVFPTAWEIFILHQLFVKFLHLFAV
jgi:hypothetical protein